MSQLEELFANQVRSLGLPEPEREYKFARDIVGHGKGIRQRLKDAGLKDWRIDFAWIDYGLFVEINGGTYINGRHNRGAALTSEYKKLNTASEQGFITLIYDSGMVKSGEAINQVEKLIRRSLACELTALSEKVGLDL